MKIVILTIVVAFYYGNDPISSQWITMYMPSYQQCLSIAETINTTTIVDNRSEWDGSTYITTAICDTKVITKDMEYENN